MASNGAEDSRRRSSRPSFALQPKSPIVHWSNLNVSSAVIERKSRSPLISHSVSLPNVLVVHDRLHGYSGISSSHHSSSVPPPPPPAAVTASSRVVHVPNTGGRSPQSKRTPSLVSKGSPNTGLSSCHLEPIVQTYQSLRHLQPALKSGLLGKRTFAPSLSVQQSCPSPPKTSVNLKNNMPTNKSYPLLSSKLKSNSNGLIQTTSAKVPTDQVKLERNPIEKLNATVHATEDYKAGFIKPVLTTVPLGSKYTDVPVNGVPLARYNIRQGYAKENDQDTCSILPDPSEAPLRVRKVSSEVEFTTVQVSETRNTSADSHRHGKPITTGIITSANTLTSTSSCLININGEFNMDVAPSTDSCAGAPGDGAIQDRALNEDAGFQTNSPQSPSVYSVTNQISAIKLTRESSCHPSGESPDLCQINVDSPDYSEDIR